LTIETPGNLYGIAFSPDGRRLVSALHRGYHKGSEVFVWDARNGHELLALKGHRDQVTSVTFTLDGHRLASATAEGTVKIWDADTGQELLALSGALGDAPFSKDGQHALAFSPDGRQLASIRENGTVIEWDAREATPESRVDREAAGLLKFFFDKPLPKGEVIEKLKGDPTISEEARRRALEFADRLRDRP
jgi:WD40 repeat protein